MNTNTIKATLSTNFYLLAILIGVLLGGMVSWSIANIVVKERAKAAANTISYYEPTGKVDQEAYEAHERKYDETLQDGKTMIAPVIIVIGIALFSFLFLAIGRHRTPIQLDAQGVDVWNWLGKKRHLWTDFQDRSIIKVRSTGANVAAFEQFHFTTGTVSVNTKRLQNGDEVLVGMNERIKSV